MSGALLSLLAFFTHACFQGWVYRGLGLLNSSPPGRADDQPLSVIIAAHNEAAALPALLERLSGQNFQATFEVIIAADRCTDGTVAVARRFSRPLPGLKILEIDAVPPDVSPKKHALLQAIAAATHDRFVFLDADVIPTDGHLDAMQRYFAGGAAVVVSLMRFHQPSSIWSDFLCFEKLLSWCIAGAGIARRQPVISYGGTWGYTRAALEAVGGFAGISSSLSGDDDLMLQKFGEKDLPVEMCLLPEGWVEMAPPPGPGTFLRQRRRHFSAGKKYHHRLQAGYLFYHLSNLFLWVGGLMSLPGLALLLLKLMMDGAIIRRGGVVFRMRYPAWKIIFFDVGYLLYNTLVGPLGHLGRIRWR